MIKEHHATFFEFVKEYITTFISSPSVFIFIILIGCITIGSIMYYPKKYEMQKMDNKKISLKTTFNTLFIIVTLIITVLGIEYNHYKHQTIYQINENVRITDHSTIGSTVFSNELLKLDSKHNDTFKQIKVAGGQYYKALPRELPMLSPNGNTTIQTSKTGAIIDENKTIKSPNYLFIINNRFNLDIFK